MGASKGVQLQIGDAGGPEVFATVARVTSIGEVKLNTATHDTTAHDNVDDFRTHAESWKTWDDIAIAGYWEPTHATQDGTAGLLSKARTAGPHNMKIIFPNGTEFAFAASLVGLGRGPAELEGELAFSGTLKISGDITET